MAPLGSEASLKSNSRIRSNPKSKAQAKAKAKAAAEKVGGDVEAEVTTKIKDVFRLADEDLSGSIQFHEFAELHSALVKLAGEKLDAIATSPKAIQQAFRELDGDQNLSLDLEEFGSYMRGLKELLGARQLLELCNQLLEDERQKKAYQDGAFDGVASNKLLELVRDAHSLRGQRADEVLELLGKRANPDFYDPCGSNVLLFAVDKAELPLLRRLIREGARPTRHNKEMDCAVFAAARAKNFPVLRLLLLPEKAGEEQEEGQLKLQMQLREKLLSDEDSAKAVSEMLAKRANPDARDELGRTPLLHAAFKGKSNSLQALLSAGRPVDVNRLDERGRSALHVAARKGFPALLGPLTRARADVDLQDGHGQTPLHHAVSNGHDEVVEMLIKDFKAATTTLDSFGCSPWMLASAPSRAAELGEKTLKLFDPNEHNNFAKRVIPVLTSDKCTFDKLEELYALPGVTSNLNNLHLYDALFSMRHGPNKVRLQKLWDGLMKELLLRQSTGKVDLAIPQKGASESERNESDADVKYRLEKQHQFLDHCLLATMGPPPSEDWTYDNREVYRTEFRETLQASAANFREELNVLYGKLQDEEQGSDLCKLSKVEVMDKDKLNQCSVHPILKWMDTLNVVSAFDALRGLQAAARTDDEAINDFLILLNDVDFALGDVFWQNIYKVWLARCASLGNSAFQKRVVGLVEKFNSTHDTDGLKAIFHSVAPKTYDVLRENEHNLGTSSHDTADGRRIASRYLDVIRCSVEVNTPKAALTLLNDVFRPMKLQTHRMRVLRIANGFSESAAHDNGYRDLVLNVEFDGGLYTCEGAKDLHVNLWSEEVSIQLVGEIRIELSSFCAVRKRMNLVDMGLAGGFDYH
eukprot:TRINITY_DN11024_c0_g1_i2.p1 TRINITY_DN11024_c0_g1~~TRINITY_DN11024_c0_g1_i2.p1  ORF type:complete len:878 (+),score=182.91 TRINITY_DN11024_c0_g1_i2:37-2634(+)